MKTVVTVVLVLLVLALAAVGFIHSGLYDVAADTPDTGLIQWALETTQNRSVQRRAEEVQAPPLDDPAVDISTILSACFKVWRSEPQIPHASVRTSTWPGPGVGSAMSSTTSSLSRMTAARIRNPPS